ncbi:MAG: hypothetical protein M1820_001188 [Bogoriella megaspora]|nr:MAG: hypothetical protein M1820_001188 [Bogoriella megaspora]
MPPYLHPRSNMTMSLFTTTLAISFLVVGAPHILPCPVHPTQRADSESDDFETAAAKRAHRLERKRLRRLQAESNAEMNGPKRVEHIAEGEEMQLGIEGSKRECPVPKPGGLIGEIMGFRKKAENEKPILRTVKIETTRSRISARETGEEG